MINRGLEMLKWYRNWKIQNAANQRRLDEWERLGLIQIAEGLKD